MEPPAITWRDPSLGRARGAVNQRGGRREVPPDRDHAGKRGELDTVFELLTAPLDGLNWLTDEIFLFLNGLFERYGVPIVFLAAVAEATVGVGVVFPGVVLLFLGGAFASGDGPTLALVLVLGIAGTVLGDVGSYLLGRYGLGRLAGGRLAAGVRLGEALLSGRTRWLIPLYHLHSATRAVGPFGAGVIGLRWRLWLPLDVAGAVIANSIWIGSGALLGRAVLTDDGRLEQHPVLRVGLLLAALVWLLVMQRIVYRKLEELGSKESPGPGGDDAVTRRAEQPRP